MFFTWIKNLFKKPQLQVNSSGYYYVVYVKGVPHIRTLTKQDAEDYIRNAFEETDVTVTKNSRFVRGINTTKHARYSSFRSYCKITKYCGTCGLSGNGCGQC